MAEEPVEQFKYWAFISYSHSDDAWAKWLHRGLETYAVPKKLIGKIGREGVTVPARPYPVFRDRDELPGAAKLTSNIEEALQQSRYLIVICSPRSATSQWVNQEVSIFKSLGREDRVLCLIVEGEPNAAGKPHLQEQECFPEAVRFWVDKDKNITSVPTEPIAADARKGKDGKSNSLLKLLAGVLGVRFDDLRQRDEERKHRRTRFMYACGVAALIAISVTAFQFKLQRDEAVQQKILANARKREAEQRKQQAEDASTLAEQRRKEAVNSAEQESIAKTNAIKAAKLEFIARTNAVEQERIAVEAKNAAVDAKEQETKAKQAAVVAQARAEEDDRQVRNTLSTVYLSAALQLIDTDGQAKALAYLARALDYDSNNVAAVTRTVSLLSQRSWALPAIPLTSSPVETLVLSPDKQSLLTVSGNTVTVWSATTRTRQCDLALGSAITFAGFSPDGKTVVTASRDNNVRLWDAASGQPKGAPLPHDTYVTTASFSADGKKLATATHDAKVMMWNVESGQPLYNHPIGAESPIKALAFYPQTNWVMVACKTSIRAWSFAKEDYVPLRLDVESNLTTAVLSPSGRALAVVSGKTSRLWDPETGQPTSDPLKHDGWVNTAEFSGDERLLVTASQDGTAQVWEVPRGKPVVSVRHQGDVHRASFSPNGRWILTASEDGTVRIWDLSSSQPIMEPLLHAGPVQDAVFSPSGQWVITAPKGQPALAWDIINGQPHFQPLRHGQQVNAAEFSPDGQTVATASGDRSARLWEVGSGHALTGALKHEDRVSDVRFSSDGKLLFTVSEGNQVRGWDAAGGQLLFGPLPHSREVPLAFSPDGQWFATAGEDRDVRVWTVATGKFVAGPLHHEAPVRSVVFGPDGHTLITVVLDNSTRTCTAHQWDLPSGRAQPAWKADADAPGEITVVAVSPDGRWIAAAVGESIIVRTNGDTAGVSLAQGARTDMLRFAPARIWGQHKWLLSVAGDSARVWDLESQKALTEPIKHEDKITKAAFSPDGILLATAAGKVARIYDVKSGKPLTDRLVHDGKILSVRFSLDGDLLATTSEDQSARIWFVSLHGPAPPWLGDLADAVGGYHLGGEGAAQMLPKPAASLATVGASLADAPPDQYAVWGKWFLADRSSRAIWPFGVHPVSDYIARALQDSSDASLSEVMRLQPDSGLALARLALHSQYPVEADFYSRQAEQLDSGNAEVLWARAAILQEQKKESEARAVMERAIAADPHRFAGFGPEGAEVSNDNREGVLASGWLPKGWMDRSPAGPLKVTYSKVTDLPPGAAAGVAINVERAESVLRSAELGGPRVLCRRSAPCVIEGWVRSAARSDLTVALVHCLEDRKDVTQQTIHTSPEWRQFRVQYAAAQDTGVELVIREPSGAELSVAGLTVKTE